MVVMATQDRLAYASRFPEALAQLLEGAATAPTTATNRTEAAEPPPGSPPRSAVSPDIANWVARANQALADYRRLTSEGKLGEAGAKLDELKRALEEMNRAAPSTAPPSR